MSNCVQIVDLFFGCLTGSTSEIMPRGLPEMFIFGFGDMVNKITVDAKVPQPLITWLLLLSGGMVCINVNTCFAVGGISHEVVIGVLFCWWVYFGWYNGNLCVDRRGGWKGGRTYQLELPEQAGEVPSVLPNALLNINQRGIPRDGRDHDRRDTLQEEPLPMRTMFPFLADYLARPFFHVTLVEAMLNK